VLNNLAESFVESITFISHCTKDDLIFALMIVMCSNVKPYMYSLDITHLLSVCVYFSENLLSTIVCGIMSAMLGPCDGNRMDQI